MADKNQLYYGDNLDVLRQNVGYPEIARIESSPRVPLVGTIQTDELNGRSRIQQ